MEVFWSVCQKQVILTQGFMFQVCILSRRVTSSVVCHRSLPISRQFPRHLAGMMSPGMKLQRAFQLLGVDPGSATVEQIREAYITAVKMYHPDSQSPHANAEKFSEVKDAYKRCVSHAKNVTLSQELYAALEEELHDINKNLGFIKTRRVAHRRYLTNDVGSIMGTQSQRQKLSEQVRLNRVIDGVFDRKFQKALENPHDKEVGPYTGDDPWLKASQQSWITHSIERLADDKIREAMRRGDFGKIEGWGKPLKREQENISLDNTTQRLNKMLLDSGAAPEWITLNKEVKMSIENLKVRIATAWHECGPHPMNESVARKWGDHLYKFQESIDDINLKVDKLNLIVPALSMQKVHLSLQNIAVGVVSGIVPDRSETENVDLSANDQEPNNGFDPIVDSLSRLISMVKHWYHYAFR